MWMHPRMTVFPIFFYRFICIPENSSPNDQINQFGKHINHLVISFLILQQSMSCQKVG
jgi:hypothetical protein